MCVLGKYFKHWSHFPISPASKRCFRTWFLISWTNNNDPSCLTKLPGSDWWQNDKEASGDICIQFPNWGGCSGEDFYLLCLTFKGNVVLFTRQCSIRVWWLLQSSPHSLQLVRACQKSGEKLEKSGERKNLVRGKIWWEEKSGERKNLVRRKIWWEEISGERQNLVTGKIWWEAKSAYQILFDSLTGVWSIRTPFSFRENVFFLCE